MKDKKDNKKDANVDRFIANIQREIIEEEEATYSKKVLEECNNPKNVGRIADPDALGIISGPCGDTMAFYLKISDNQIKVITFTTDGCGATIACGSMLSTIAKGKSIHDASDITKDDLLTALDGLPDENLHCSVLAVNTLQKAIKNYHEKEDK